MAKASKARSKAAAAGKRKSPAPKPSRRNKHKKQAVVVIHGIGEQVPMATLWGLVESVWSKDSGLSAPVVEITRAGARVEVHPD